MSSIITDVYQRTFEAIQADNKISIATPFMAIHLRQQPVIDFGSEQITHEMYKGNRKVAPLVSRRNAGSDVDDVVIRPGVSGANDYMFALASQDFELPAGVLNKRTPMEPLYMGSGNGDDIKLYRQRYWLYQLSRDATRRVIRRNELLAKQSFFDAEMNIGDTFNGATKLSFVRSSSLKARTVTTSWATKANATPWDDIGDAQREIKSKSQIDGGSLWTLFLSSTSMTRLKDCYRSQRTNETGPVLEYNEFRFNSEESVPAELAFLVQNGMEYGGWIRSEYSNGKVYLFTLPEGYDATADDSATTYTDMISGDTVALCAYSREYFKAYFGPGKKTPPSADFYTANFPVMSMPSIPASGLTIGQSGLPARSLILNVYPLGKNEGMGGTIEHAPIYAPVYPDIVATIATTTTA
jgi:hypothetical protein